MPDRENEKYKLMIFAGEASADLQASALGNKLKKLLPGIDLMGVGGPRMKDEGFRLFYDSSTWSAIGVIEGFARVPKFFSIMRGMAEAIVSEKPDLIIFIDSPAINMRLAKFARKRKFKTLYYFPPSAWTKKVKRAKAIAGRVDHVIATFSFTADFYREHGIPIEYFGHPLLDLVERITPQEAIRNLGLKENTVYLGLLPGSRVQEVKTLLPVMIETGKILKEKIPGLEFLLPVALPVLNDWIRPQVEESGLPVHIFEKRNFEVMQASNALLMSSGSATLEGAIMKKPMTVIYRLNKFDWHLANFLMKSPHASLPNIMLGRGVLPEFLQDNMTAPRISQEVYLQLTDPARRQEIAGGLEKIREFLGEPGVIDRVAEYIAGILINDKK